MADVVDAATRSRMMSRIRGRDTKIEVAVRKTLHSRGLRYRVNDRRLPGRPDIVLPRRKAVVLVHGCFWHAHDCGLCRIPATRPEFWRDKLDANAARDARSNQALLDAGWRVAIVWECAIRGKGPEALSQTADKILGWLQTAQRTLEIGAAQPRG